MTEGACTYTCSEREGGVLAITSQCERIDMTSRDDDAVDNNLVQRVDEGA